MQRATLVSVQVTDGRVRDDQIVRGVVPFVVLVERLGEVYDVSRLLRSGNASMAYGPLRRLRHLAGKGIAGYLRDSMRAPMSRCTDMVLNMRYRKITHLCFEDIDLRRRAADVRAISVDGPRVRLPRASAAGESLPREVRKLVLGLLVPGRLRGDGQAVESLVWGSADVTRVVAVRPL